MGASLRSGHPVGTHFNGAPVTVFQYSSDSRLHFFLSPVQIRNLHADLDGSAQVIGASGVRRLPWGIGETANLVGADFVSPGFFSALGVEFVFGTADEFARTEDGVVLSDSFVRHHGLAVTPQVVHIGERALRVVGVVRGFDGLFDQESQAWIHWAQSEGLLYPNRRSPDNTPMAESAMWFFWTLAIPEPGQRARFDTLMAGLKARKALVEPPFDELRVVPGITNEMHVRIEADQSQSLYEAISGLLLLIAALATAFLTALIRLDRVSSEWTMLRLGAPQVRLFVLPWLYALFPLLAAALLAMVLALWIGHLLHRDPALMTLMNGAARLKDEGVWSEFAMTLGAVVLICAAFNAMVMRGAGLRFSASALRARTERLDPLLHAFHAAIAAAATFALAVGLLAASESLARASALASEALDHVWVQSIGSGTDSSDPDADLRQQLQARLRAQIPAAQNSGFVSLTPLQGAMVQASEYRGPNGSVSLLRNEASADAFAALNLDLLAGRVFAESSQEAVLDEDAAKSLQAAVAPAPILGAQISDEDGMAWTVVGVVRSLPYRADPTELSRVIYVPMSAQPVSLSLVVRGVLSQHDLAVLRDPRHAEIMGRKVSEPLALSQLADRRRSRHQARSTLTLVTSACALVVSVFLLVCASLLRAKRRARDYAIRLALGATEAHVLSHFLRRELLGNLFGCTLGTVLFMLLNVPERLGLRSALLAQGSIAASVLALFVAASLGVLWLSIRPRLTTRALAPQLQDESGC